MQMQRNMSTPRLTIRGLLVLLLVICLVECTKEQGIKNGRSMASNSLKTKGWRSQRGGSCLSYGHSCWGAHGKRSASKQASSAPDWFNKILRSMSNNEMNREDGIYRNGGVPSEIYEVEEVPQLGNRGEAKPMLDQDILSKMKIWEILRAASQDD